MESSYPDIEKNHKLKGDRRSQFAPNLRRCSWSSRNTSTRIDHVWILERFVPQLLHYDLYKSDHVIILFSRFAFSLLEKSDNARSHTKDAWEYITVSFIEVANCLRRNRESRIGNAIENLRKRLRKNILGTSLGG
uniref:Uncharacterized protein n=1 Tax=Rhizophagus irregularis (strain DAOM 181602 / DAOM 197198 / MUCL 43194) TaxID=747089 RepID=U9SI68_RHIID